MEKISTAQMRALRYMIDERAMIWDRRIGGALVRKGYAVKVTGKYGHQWYQPTTLGRKAYKEAK